MESKSETKSYPDLQKELFIQRHLLYNQAFKTQLRRNELEIHHKSMQINQIKHTPPRYYPPKLPSNDFFIVRDANLHKKDYGPLLLSVHIYDMTRVA
jgi:hypothetical protein